MSVEDRADTSRLETILSRSTMGRSVASHEWASTPLGPIETWSDGLKLAASICLSSRFPILITWGPDLIKIYNDGYRPMLGEKHPSALGMPASEVWPEVWHTIGPMFESVMSTGLSTWAEDEMLVLHRNGFAEECYFTFSFSPLFDHGRIAGVLDLVAETTDQVLARRRLECLFNLHAALTDGEQVIDVCARAAATLADFAADVRAVDVYLQAADELVLIATSRRGDVIPLDHDSLTSLVDTRSPVVRGGDAAGTAPAEQFVQPLGDDSDSVQGVLVLSLNQRRPFDDEYRRFVTLVATAIGASLDAASRRTAELTEYRRVSDTLQAAMLKPSSDLPTVAARYLPALGKLAVGGDWYDVIDLGESQRGLIVGDCVGHGLDAATVMAQLRSAARSMMLEGRNPASVLDGLDTFAAALDGADCATVVCAVVDRDRNTLTYSRAGHPPPLLVGTDDIRWLDDAGGPPLAVTVGGARRDVELTIGHDDVIVMYSDGLIERRGEALDVGLERLADAMDRLRGRSVQGIADGLLEAMAPETTRDDVVVLVKRLSRTADEAAERRDPAT